MIGLVLARIDDEGRDRVPTQEIRTITSNAYLAAARWFLSPFLIGVGITLAIYFITGYQNSIVNHATVLGLILGILMMLKSRVEHHKALVKAPPDG